MVMKLIIGLGNPGPEYEHNRHNVGFLFVNYMASRISENTENWQNDQKMSAEYFKYENKYVFVKPQTFMNRSGEAVTKVMQFYKIALQDVIVIHDDLDIRIGEYKISMGKGPKLHNGTGSVENKIGKDFLRVRIGVENRTPDSHIPGVQYVLQNFSEPEIQTLEPVFEKIYKELTISQK